MWKAFNSLFRWNTRLSEILAPVALGELQNLLKRPDLSGRQRA